MDTGIYVIESEIGRGGMATVYLAHDRKHERRVAIKVLHAELAAMIGTERFLQEIRVTAQLQHPHILGLIDSGVFGPDAGECAGRPYYVMPYVEGESLRARLERDRQLPVADVIRLACELASALDYAHRHGVVHRDIKPENILLHDGSALVADFGIALAVQQAGGARLTQTGLSLGTPQYMSPEQAMGERTIDARSDIYALGAVTYEMLVGEAPFAGPTAQAVIARVLTEEPRAIQGQRKSVPPQVEAAVMRALEKIPADRFTSASEFADALGDARASPSGVSTTSHRTARAGKEWRALSVAHAAVTIAASGLAALFWIRAHDDGSPPALVRFTLAFPQAERVSDLAHAPIAISPDGMTIVYVADGGPRQLYARPLADLAAHPLPGTDGASMPFFSPDGRWVGFVNLTSRKMFKVALSGGAVVTVAENVGGLGASWASDNAIVTGAQSEGKGLELVSVADGRSRVLTTPSRKNGDFSHRSPKVLSDGTSVLFTSWSGNLRSSRIAIGDVTFGTYTVLDITGTSPLGVFEGKLLYLRSDGTLMAVPVDVRGRRVTGQALPVLEGVSVYASGASRIAASNDGSLVYVTGVNASRLVLADDHGAARPLFDAARNFGHPRFSPDGQRIALDIIGKTTEIWIYDLAARSLTPLTTGGNNDRPEWSPDGRRILYRSGRSGGTSGLWWQASDGSGAADSLFQTHDGPHAGVLTPDGKTLVYRVTRAGSRRDIWQVGLGGDRTPRPIVATPFDETLPRISPDGRWLAYVSDESGELEIYVRPFPGPGGRWQVSAGGGSEPIWSRAGDRLFYRNGKQLLAAVISAAPAFSVKRRDLLFESDLLTDNFHANFDVAPDGRRFVMLAPSGSPEQVVVALHFATTLRGDAKP